MIRRNILSEENQAWIAIALFQIAEHLVVGAVLFDDVDHVLEMRVCLGVTLLAPSVCGFNPLRVVRQLSQSSVFIQDSQRAIQLSEVVRRMLHALSWNWAVGVGVATVSLASENKQMAV